MSRATPPAGPLGKLLAFVAATILLVLGLMFSVVLLAVFVVVGVALGAWFFWKTRHVRKAMQESGAMNEPPAEGHVIEGEAIMVEEYRDSETVFLPDDSRKP